jgi:hypothetical protein
MSADLHLHIVTKDMTREDFQSFFGNSLGSKYSMFTQQVKMMGGEAPDYNSVSRQEFSSEFQWQATEKMSKSPSIWIGEVSWLKAAIFKGGNEEFVRTTVQKVQEIVGEDQPVIDDELIAKIVDAFGEENKTQYRITSVKKVWTFLQEHRGEKVFTISW